MTEICAICQEFHQNGKIMDDFSIGDPPIILNEFVIHWILEEDHPLCSNFNSESKSCNKCINKLNSFYQSLIQTDLLKNELLLLIEKNQNQFEELDDMQIIALEETNLDVQDLQEESPLKRNELKEIEINVLYDGEFKMDQEKILKHEEIKEIEVLELDETVFVGVEETTMGN